MNWLILLLLSACSTQIVYNRPALSNQILVFRKGHVGLTNGVCKKYKADKCEVFHVEQHDLNDKSFREQLMKLRFLCRVGNERYLVCKDKPGLCQISYKWEGPWQNVKIFGKWVMTESYIDQTDIEYLLNANTTCFNRDEYPDL